MKGITTDTNDIKRLISECFKQLYANKLDNVNKMDKFLETKIR